MSFCPRFSLLSLMLVATLVCVSIAYWQTSRRADTQELTIIQLRDELGHLNVDDPKKAYVRQVPTSESFVWEFRVYLPPERKWHLFTKLDGRMHSAQSNPQLHGHFTQTTSLKKLEVTDEYVISYTSSTRNGIQAAGTLDKDKGDRLYERENAVSHVLWNSLQHDQHEFALHMPVELIQGVGNCLQVYFSTDDPMVVMQEQIEKRRERQRAREERRSNKK